MNKVILEISARHVHLSQEDLDTLFGKGYKLTEKRPLSQPGQFAAEERVQVIGSKKSFPSVSILGPVRKNTQIELSLTDARAIGVDAPVRESGDVKGSGAVKLVGPCGEVELDEGVIVAKRHVHLTPADAEKFSIKDKQIISLKIESNDRSLVFNDVVARVSASFATRIHIDTDEANAAGISGETEAEIIV